MTSTTTPPGWEWAPSWAQKNSKPLLSPGPRPHPYANPGKLYQMIVRFFKEMTLFKARERRWGHTTSMPARYYRGTEGIKNKQLAWDPICDLSNPVLLEQQYKLWSDGCAMCNAGCKVPYLRRDPPLGPVAGEMRQDRKSTRL